MPRKITFIHAADCHLGAAFKGVLAASGPVGAHLVRAVSDAFDNIIAACLEHKVDFLILAGDTFNEGEVAYGVQSHFLDAMRRLDRAGIRVYLCTGNHDPLSSWAKRLEVLPGNVCIFPSEQPGYFLHERGGIPLAVLAGRGYETREEPRDLTEGLDRKTAIEECGEQVPFALGVLHTGITDPRYAPCDVNRLHTAGFDYYALGHIHERRAAGGLPVVYAGSPQGLDINEGSDHCCVLVTLEENRAPVYEAIETAAVVWARPTVDISGLKVPEDLSVLLGAQGRGLLAEHHRPVCARITLTGAGPLHGFLKGPQDVQDLCEALTTRCSSGKLWFWVERIVDGTSAPRDLEALRAEGLFPTTVMEEADKARAGLSGVQDMIREAFADFGLGHEAASLDIVSLVEEAEGICLDGLLGEGDR